MTSNQVAFSLGLQNVSETTRHNKESESIARDELDLRAKLNEATIQWEKERNRLTAEYNQAKIAYDNASLDWKEQYEYQMAQIQQDLANAEIMYKKDMSEYNQKIADVQEKQQTETARHNLLIEELEGTKNWVSQKHLEYQQNATILENAMKDAQLKQNLLIARENQSNQLAIANLENKMREQQLTIEQQKVANEERKTIISSVLDAIKTGASVGSALLLGGLKK